MPTLSPPGFVDAVRLGLLGVRAAWRAPWVIAHDLPAQLAPPVMQGMPVEGAAFASRAAHAALARLARVAPARWRNTCLYRSVAECLVLRRLGHPARLVIGVGADSSAVIAHAWVECDGLTCLSSRGAAELEALSVRGLQRDPAPAGSPR